VPWHFLRERNGVVLRWATLNTDDTFDIAAFTKLLTPRTKLVAVTHMSNVLGTITPLSEIIRLAHAAGAKVLIDGCQGAVHQPVDVQALDATFTSARATSSMVPRGSAFSRQQYEHLKRMRPYQAAAAR